MKVGVDLEKCQGHARCWATDPELFTLDDEGISDIGPAKHVPVGLEQVARDAVLSCPEDALTIIE